ncbi:MAG TPA: cytochrome c-type biogenesis protein CcmH [Gaiellaceae bacterium]|nr:cytochrome c-type biogenesis protein CcmH [Gaiellaceae bacterium]
MRLLAAMLVAFALAAPAAASERHPTLGELEHEVMCPTCKTLLELSHAPIAERMRAFIRGRIAAGETKSEIEQQLVAQFGPGVLAEPPRSGLGLLAWLLPLAGLLGGVAVLAVVAHRWRRAVAAPADLSLDADSERRLERALAEFD